MNLRKQLLADHSKQNTNLILEYIGNNQERFDALMELFLNDEYRVTQRAAWVVGDMARKHFHLVSPHLERLVLNLKKPEIHDAIKRNTIRVLQEMELPEALWGETADVCFKFLISKNEPIAVKCFSMTVLLRITQKVPELKEELRVIIEDQLPYGSAGFKSRANKTLKALEKI